MTGDSGEDSGSGQEDLFGPFARVYPPAAAPTVSSTKHAATTPEDPKEPPLHNVTSTRSSTFLNFTDYLNTINVLGWPSSYPS